MDVVPKRSFNILCAIFIHTAEKKVQCRNNPIIPQVPGVSSGAFLVLINIAAVLNETPERLILVVALIFRTASLKNPGFRFSRSLELLGKRICVVNTSLNDIQIVFTPNLNAQLVSISQRKSLVNIYST